MEQQVIDLVKQGDSTLLVAIVVMVFLALLAMPFVKTMASIRSTARREAQSREDLLIQVIQANTEVNSSLKTLIETDQKNCEDCKREQFEILRTIQTSQEKELVKLVEIQGSLQKDGD